MKTLNTLLLALLVALGVPLVASAQSPASGSIAGTVHAPSGAPISGAHVHVSGQVRQETTSDAQGAFTFSALPAGLYRIDITAGGFTPASADDVAVVAGQATPLSIVLAHASLSSLTTIASVTTSGHSSINTGAAASNYTSAQAFTSLANPQINNVVATIPGAAVERGSSSPNTSISLGGVQPYETQVLVDGHPMSAGRYGVWFSQFFSSWMVQGVETEIGPGNTTPFAGTAVGGTANFITKSFTSTPTFDFVTGYDSYDSTNSNFLVTGGSKLKYVFGLGYAGSNGPYYGRYGCTVTPSSTALDNAPGSSGIVQFCGDLGGSYFAKGELAKLRYDFSSATSFEAGFVGSQSGYLPQGTAYGQYVGNFNVTPCLKSNPNACTNPNFSQYTGSSIPGYIFYPGSNVYNDQPLFTGEFRTSLGDNTILLRPYAGNIGRIIDGSGESNFADFYYPNTAAASTCTGGPAYGLVGPVQGSETECLEGPFSVLEFDKLKGNTFSFIHPFGDNVVNFTYDFHSDETFAYYNTPSDVVVPNTTAKFNTLSATGDLALQSDLTLKYGLYDNIWNLDGEQALALPGGKTQLASLTRTIGRVDPHLALIFQPTGGTSYRLSYGTSETFPYASLVSGTSNITKPSATAPNGTFNLKDPYLNPESANEFDLGADKRFHNGSVLSADLTSTQVHNVFETVSTYVNLPNYTYIEQPVNAALLSADEFTVKYGFTPSKGLGYSISATADRSIVSGLPNSFYTSKSLVQPANGQQQCSNGGSEVCIPYLKAYGQLNYTLADKTYFQLGADFEGKNNTYNQPPFVIYDLSVRRPLNREVDMQVSIENLLNTNNFQNLPEPNAGVAQVGQSSLGLGSILAPLIPAPPRTVRLQLEYHVGK